MKEPAAIAAMLVTRAFVPRSELPEMLDHLVYRDVEGRLQQVGMELVDSAHLDDYCIRPLTDAKFSIMDSPSNERLTDREAALLVVMWAKLVLPRHSEAPGPHRIMPETIQDEFGTTLGGSTALTQALGRLTSLGFLQYREGYYEAGAYLEAAIDHQQMWTYVEGRTVLQSAANKARDMVDTRSITSQEAVRLFFQSTTEKLPPREVAVRLGLSSEQVSEALHELRQEGFLEHNGMTGRNVRYWRA